MSKHAKYTRKKGKKEARALFKKVVEDYHGVNARLNYVRIDCHNVILRCQIYAGIQIALRKK